MGLINFGIQLGTTGVVAYVVDCHREQAGEAFAAMNVSSPLSQNLQGPQSNSSSQFIKNMFAFGMTFYINNWIAVQGVRDCFFTIAGITIVCTLTTIPM